MCSFINLRDPIHDQVSVLLIILACFKEIYLPLNLIFFHKAVLILGAIYKQTVQKKNNPKYFTTTWR